METTQHLHFHVQRNLSDPHHLSTDICFHRSRFVDFKYFTLHVDAIDDAATTCTCKTVYHAAVEVSLYTLMKLFVFELIVSWPLTLPMHRMFKIQYLHVQLTIQHVSKVRITRLKCYHFVMVKLSNTIERLITMM